MFLGIEIGGTKLQLAVSDGHSEQLAAMERRTVDPRCGAEGILDQIASVGRELISKHDVRAVGFGFGGPIDSAQGRVVTSHQISGWDNFPLVEWCGAKLGLPAVLGNDCDSAALAEARMGAGRGKRSVFFVTVGTGVGGGVVVEGKLHGAGRPAVAEIGHLRPGLEAVSPYQTVESIAAGPGIEKAVRQELARHSDDENTDALDLLQRCGGNAEQVTAKIVGEAAIAGNSIAEKALDYACRTLGWAFAQVVTLVAPEVIVVGGGVSLIGEQQFFVPVRKYLHTYVFPPLRDTCPVVPAGLGELTVVYGALALARDSHA